MLEFTRLCFLDMPYTSADQVRTFLKRFVEDDIINDVAHAPAYTYDPSKFYLMTVRDPVDYYLTIFAMASEGRGHILHLLEKEAPVIAHACDGTADGLRTVMNFMLNPQNAELLSPGYGGIASELFGFMTYHMLQRALRYPTRDLMDMTTKQEVTALFRTRSRVGKMLRAEQLRDGLLGSCARELRSFIPDQSNALRYIRDIDVIDTPRGSQRTYLYNPPRSIVMKIREREWFFYEQLGYTL